MPRRLRRVLGTFVAVLTACLVLGASPAAAGGPTSVLVVEPGSGKTAAAYYDDPAYAALDGLLTSGRSGPRQAADGSYGDRGIGRSVTVTWLIHDVSVWRVDRVFPDAPGGPWVLTSTWDDSGALPAQGTWSRPDDPTKLMAVLDGILSASAAMKWPNLPAPATTTVTATSTVVTMAAPPTHSAAGPVAATGTSSPGLAVLAGGSASSSWSSGAVLATGAVTGALLVLLAWAATSMVARRRTGPTTLPTRS